jgi:hypothetical protein
MRNKSKTFSISRSKVEGGKAMIKGCANHGCILKETPDKHNICECVAIDGEVSCRIQIEGQLVGPYDYFSNCQIIRDWLRGGGLRDILKLATEKDETDKKGE